MAILTPEERVGTTIAEKYRIDGVLGEGGWGVVLAGTHLWTDREVAIKLLHPQHARKEAMVKRFLKEAKAAARIKHPNVVDVLDMGREGDDVYLVLERLHGQTLRELLDERGTLSISDTLDLLGPVLDALTEAHERKIVHRDIKPDNIFLARERDRVVPKLLDFGIAKMMEEGSHTTTGTVVGTPSYMAPEQVQGALDITAATDVWSMGVVVFECLTGQVPFDAPNVAAILVQILTAEPPTLESLRPELREASAVLAQALSKSRTERYADAGALRRALDEIPRSGAALPVRGRRERSGEHDPTLDASGEHVTEALGRATPADESVASKGEAGGGARVIATPAPMRAPGQPGRTSLGVRVAGIAALVLAVTVGAVVASVVSSSQAPPEEGATREALEGDSDIAGASSPAPVRDEPREETRAPEPPSAPSVAEPAVAASGAPDAGAPAALPTPAPSPRVRRAAVRETAPAATPPPAPREPEPPSRRVERGTNDAPIIE